MRDVTGLSWRPVAALGTLLVLGLGTPAAVARALTCPPGTTAGAVGCQLGVGSLPGVPLPGQQQPDVQPTPSPSPSPTVESPPPDEAAGIGIQQVQWWVLSSTSHELQQLKPVVTQPTLTPGDWFKPLYGRMTAIAVWLLGLFLLLAVLQALVRGDLSLLGEAVLKHLPAAVLATAGVVSFTLLLMRITDDLCGFVLQGLGDQVWQMLTDAAGVALAAATDLGWWGFWATLLGVLGLLAVVTIGLELLARMALIYLALLFLPLAFAAMVWPAARGLVRRLLELLVGLIASKLVLVVVLVMAGMAFAAGVPVLPDQHPPQGEPAIADLLMGVVLLLIGAMSPWVLVRLIPLVETAASQHFHQAIVSRHPLSVTPQLWQNDLRWWKERLERVTGRFDRLRGSGRGDGDGRGDDRPRPAGTSPGDRARFVVPVVASSAERGGARTMTVGTAGVVGGTVAAVGAAAEPLRQRAGIASSGEVITLSSSGSGMRGVWSATLSGRVPVEAALRQGRPEILLPGRKSPAVAMGRGEILLPDGRRHPVPPPIVPSPPLGGVPWAQLEPGPGMVERLGDPHGRAPREAGLAEGPNRSARFPLVPPMLEEE
jgi:hypothetical protein